MSEKWARLGAEVRRARDAKGLTQAELGARVGKGDTTIANIENARLVKITRTMRDVARELGWAEGSVEAVLAGGDPIAAEAAPPEVAAPATDPPAASVADGLPMRVARILAEGAPLDTTIVPLSDDADMVVLVMGKPTATPAALRAVLEDWERRGGYLERLGLTPKPPASDDPSAGEQ